MENEEYCACSEGKLNIINKKKESGEIKRNSIQIFRLITRLNVVVVRVMSKG